MNSTHLNHNEGYLAERREEISVKESVASHSDEVVQLVPRPHAGDGVGAERAVGHVGSGSDAGDEPIKSTQRCSGVAESRKARGQVFGSLKVGEAYMVAWGGEWWDVNMKLKIVPFRALEPLRAVRVVGERASIVVRVERNEAQVGHIHGKGRVRVIHASERVYIHQ